MGPYVVGDALAEDLHLIHVGLAHAGRGAVVLVTHSGKVEGHDPMLVLSFMT